MSAAVQILAPTTAAVQVVYNAMEADKIAVCINTAGALAAGETVVIYLVTSSGNVQYCQPNSGGINIALAGTGGINSYVLEGGFIYMFQKSATAGAVGLEVLVKPRIGNY